MPINYIVTLPLISTQTFELDRDLDFQRMTPKAYIIQRPKLKSIAYGLINPLVGAKLISHLP